MKKPASKNTPASASEAVSKKQVAIVDDHTMMREGLKQSVNAEPDMEVCWAAGSVAETLNALEHRRPDILTVDITLPGRNGLELIKDVLALVPGLPILVISMHEESLYAQRVLKGGAKGYIMKDAPHEDLMRAIRRVSDGKVWLSAKMSEEILDAFSGGQPRRPVDSVQKLSDREFEVFQLLGEGRSTNQIADSLNISTKTVDVHKSHIREKLELEDSSAALRHAIRWTETKRLAGD
jgi:DNA-binding NarL/FixJ family response regulator